MKKSTNKKKIKPKENGRPFVYETGEQLEIAANEYFNKCDNNTRWKRTDFIKSGERAGELVDINLPTPYTIEGLCLHLKISTQTFYNYLDADMSPKLFDSASRIRDKVREQHLSGAMSGLFNPVIVSRIQGLRDNLDVTTDGVKIQPITNLLFNTDTFKADK